MVAAHGRISSEEERAWNKPKNSWTGSDVAVVAAGSL